MGLGELLTVILILGIASLVVTVIAVAKAAQNGDTPWLIGIIGGWFVGFGWLVAIVYLVAVAPNSPGPTARPTSAPYLPPPDTVGPPSGWHPDPVGRFELRYWDGTRWTEHVSRDGVPGVDRL